MPLQCDDLISLIHKLYSGLTKSKLKLPFVNEAVCTKCL